MRNLFSVKGKIAVITGGSRGIGAMMAQGLVENGAKVYITARKLKELEATAEALSDLGDCVAIASDLSTLAGVQAFASELKERETCIHLLFNNAGATWGETIENFPESGWDKVMDLNVKSPFFLIQQLLPSLRAGASAEDPARIINIASVNGLINSKMTNYSYSASKAALIHLTRHLAADLVRDNINVNGIAPGFFPSKMTAFIHEDEHADEFIATIPRGCMGSAEDAAGTAIYLSSRASAYITGQTIIVDGGMHANAG